MNQYLPCNQQDIDEIPSYENEDWQQSNRICPICQSHNTWFFDNDYATGFECDSCGYSDIKENL